jgi:hypothetical protein
MKIIVQKQTKRKDIEDAFELPDGAKVALLKKMYQDVKHVSPASSYTTHCDAHC